MTGGGAFALFTKPAQYFSVKIMKSFFTFAAALCVLATGVHSQDKPASADKRPNILFIIADDWGKHAKSYGTGNWIDVPNFDRIAREGILFDNAFTSNPKCAPCRASITTGRNSWQLKEGVQHFNPWPKEFITYPDILEDAGYFVGYTGKGWGPGDYKSAGRKNNPAGPNFDKFKTEAPAKYVNANDYARNFIESFMAERPKDKPFCFWIGFYEPHRPYEDGVGERHGKNIKNVEIPSYYPKSDIIKSDMADYAFEIEYADSHVKKILDYLESIGELENTIIVYTSDHGMPFPRVKGQIYEEGFNVPLAVRWGKIAKPRKEETFINVRDFAPTFLEAAGVAKHPQMTGKSFLPLLKSEKPTMSPADQFMLVGKERHDLGRPGNAGYPVRAIRTEDYLFIYNFTPDAWPVGNPETGYRNCDDSPTKSFLLRKFDKWYALSFGKRPQIALYDIKKDRGCVNNLAKDPAYAKTLEELQARMFEELKKDGDFRALGQDTSWVDKVPWVGNSADVGSYDSFLEASKNQD